MLDCSIIRLFEQSKILYPFNFTPPSKRSTLNFFSVTAQNVKLAIAELKKKH